MSRLQTWPEYFFYNPFPIILMGRTYWSGLLAWIKKEVVGQGRLDSASLDLFTVTDDVQEVVSIVAQCCR